MRRYILTYPVISKANFSTHVKIKQRAVYEIIKFHALYRNKSSTKVQTLSIINILCRHTSIGAADVVTNEIHLRLEWKPNGSPRDHAKGKNETLMFLSSTRILKSGPSVQYRIFRPLSRVNHIENIFNRVF